MYVRFVKRLLDFLLSLCAIIILSPLLLILTIIGVIKLGGNPFFTQERPGWNERIFHLIKFRTMDNRKDATGKLLPDSVRLNKYGRFLRSTSLDELPELFNILKGDMSIVGPRPLMKRYLDYYTKEEKKRHCVRPGLTGYAQVHGRNLVSWSDRLKEDVYYVENLKFSLDVKIIFQTVVLVLKREGTGNDNMLNFDDFRKQEWVEKNIEKKVMIKEM